MKSKTVSDERGAEVHVVILDSGEEAFAALTKFANDAKLSAASLTAIGAFEKAVVGWFDFASKSYRKIEVNEQCEVLSAIGDVAVGDDGNAPAFTFTSCWAFRTAPRAAAIYLRAGCDPPSKWSFTEHRQHCAGRRGRISASPSSISAQTSAQRKPSAFSSCRLLIFERPSMWRRCALA